MADPLSIAANVAGLVSLGLQSTDYLYQFYTTYRDRDEDLAKIADRLDELLVTLRSINDVVFSRHWRADDDSIVRNIETCISRCEDVINDFRDEILKFSREPATSLSRRIVVAGRRAAYPFRRSTLEKLSEDIRDFHDNLSQALGVLQLKEHQNAQQEVEVLKEMMRYSQAKDLARSLRDWLSAPDPSIDLNAAAAKKHSGTGQWFIQSQHLNTWLRQDNSFLWLYGFAGCGKSVLCSTIISHVFRQRQSQADCAVTYFFFTFNDRSKQDTSALLRALLVQLAGQTPGVEAELMHLKETCRGSLPPVLTLLEYVKSAIIRKGHVHILLDALDECPEGDLRDGVMKTIETIRQWSIPGLHLLVTSRRVIDIRDALSPLAQEMVHLKNDEISNDIRKYVSYCVEHDPKLRHWQDDRQVIRDHLVRHANGVFRWVECQLEPLRRCPHSKFDLAQCLTRLPSTLDATYERMLSAIDEYAHERARRILMLLCLAQRDLHVAEVIEAIAVDVDGQECYDPTRRLGGADDLLRICPGLIEIVPIVSNPSMSAYCDAEHENGQHGDDFVDFDNFHGSHRLATTPIVRLAHFSVQEYLFSDRIRKGSAASFAVSELADHEQISKACLIYLCYEEFVSQPMTPQLVQRYAFASFAAQYWFDHFRKADAKASGQLQAWGVVLCKTKVNLNRWVNLFDVDKKEYQRQICYDARVTESLPAIYYLAILGLHGILGELLKEVRAEVNVEVGYYGNSLQAASWSGHEKVVQMLLDAGANVNAQGGQYGNALRAASYSGHEKVVQMLLDAGANVNAQGGEYGHALRAASYGGHEKVVQMLLSAGADVNAEGVQYGRALQAASYGGHEKVVQVLLDAGADVNAQGGYFGNALQAVSLRGYEKVVQILLDAGADVNAQGGQYGNALQAASWNGHERVVQMLLDAGASVSIPGGRYGTALQAASSKGHGEVVKMLLDAGADVKVQGGFYGHAIQAASWNGYKKVVQMLLDAGADVNVQSGHYGHAIQAASWNGHEKTVQMLLNAGANVKAQGGYYGHAIQAASWNGHEKVVQVLLDAGADVNMQGGHYGRAIQAASWSGHETVVQMLLDAGADVNAQGGQYGNALQAASWNGHERVVQMLLDAGAIVNTQGGEHHNALHAASTKGHEKMVQMLLDAGADVNTHEGARNSTPQAA